MDLSLLQLWTWHQGTPLNDVPQCTHAIGIYIWGIPTINYPVLYQYQYSSKLLGNIWFILCLIQYPNYRSPPSYMSHPYEYKNQVLPYIYSYIYKSNFGLYYCWPFPYGNLPECLNLYNKKWWTCFSWNCYPNYPRQKTGHHHILHQTHLNIIHTSSLTSLEVNEELFDQGRHIMGPKIIHHKILSTTTHLEPINFGKNIKGPECVNWIKGAYTQFKIFFWSPHGYHKSC